MSAPTVWPWKADSTPAEPPAGVRTAVAVLAVPDPDDFHPTLREQLGPMTAATLATLGLRMPEVTGVIPPYTFKGRGEGIVYLAAMREEAVRPGTNVREVDGYTLAVAHEQLLASTPRGFLMVMAIGALAVLRAGRLS